MLSVTCCRIENQYFYFAESERILTPAFSLDRPRILMMAMNCSMRRCQFVVKGKSYWLSCPHIELYTACSDDAGRKNS